MLPTTSLEHTGAAVTCIICMQVIHKAAVVGPTWILKALGTQEEIIISRSHASEGCPPPWAAKQQSWSPTYDSAERRDEHGFAMLLAKKTDDLQNTHKCACTSRRRAPTDASPTLARHHPPLPPSMMHNSPI